MAAIVGGASSSQHTAGGEGCALGNCSESRREEEASDLHGWMMKNIKDFLVSSVKIRVLILTTGTRDRHETRDN